MTTATICRQALTLLAAWQQPDGSFAGWASASITRFKPSRPQPTIFPTILILDALAEVPETQAITKMAATYVLGQREEQGSWGYWSRASQATQKEPYPDDLDDTACAVAALHKFDSNQSTPTSIGLLARLLVAAEIQPGGPYNTWLVDHKIASQWRHVDVAVNANVGYALAQQGACPTGLQAYLSECIVTRKLQSDYYVEIAPTLYFLARWYTGPARAELKRIVFAELESCKPETALQAALLVLAAKHLGVTKAKYAPLTKYLQESFNSKTGWSAAALYVDPVYDGKQHYGGSQALTTALALHAITFIKKAAAASTTKPEANNDTSMLAAQSISNTAARREFLQVAQRVMAAGAQRQITQPATIICEAGSFEIPAKTLDALNQASLHGWVAYTAYDDFLDDEASTRTLAMANMAHRRSCQLYLQALPDSAAFHQQVNQAFDAMDSASIWEMSEARAATVGGRLQLEMLPDYGDYQVLADRSWGHSLAASGVMLQASSVCFSAMQSFFKHFLIARQLNDDAHDWEDDLAKGHISSVVTLLLRDFNSPVSLQYDQAITELRQLFWQHTIIQVSQLIQDHLTAAHRALAACKSTMNITELESWLTNLESATALALKTRDDTLEFIRGFGGSND